MNFYNIFTNIKQLSELTKQKENPMITIYQKIKKMNKEVKKIRKVLKDDDKISIYSIKDLSTKETIFLRDDLTDEEINNFIYINPSTKITIRNFTVVDDEYEHLKRLVNIFSKLETHNRQYNITIHIENRHLLNKSNLLNIVKNINLTIHNYCIDYTKEEYLENETKINKIISTIQESDLSPYEKFIATYNKVKQLKEYKENKENPRASRSLKDILDNEYIVCVGFSELLTTLLERLNIQSIPITVNTDTREMEKINQEEGSILGSHERNIVKIDDDKYNIHGIYLVDATWDNDINYDIYTNAAITFDKKKESYILESLETEDLILDFHNFKEFNQKINFYLKREINESTKDTYQDKVIFEYLFLYYKILEILIKLDYKEYQTLYQKYDNQIKDIIKRYENNQENLKHFEDIFSLFLTDYANYIIPLSNNEIEKEKLYQAAYIIKKNIDKLSELEIEEWYQETKEANDILEELRFPYIYHKDSLIPNYLTSKKRILTK